MFDGAPAATIVREDIGYKLAEKILQRKLFSGVELPALMTVLVYFIERRSTVEALVTSILS